MSVPVVMQTMKHHYNGVQSEFIYLRQEAGTSRLLTDVEIAKEIEETSSLSVGDVTHVLGIFMTEIRKVLVRGDRVRVAGLGTFYMTLSCKGVETEEECNVRNIRRVNIRFLPDKSLKLVNNSLAPTRSDNNVTFAIKGAKAPGITPGGDGEEDDDDYVDPNA